MAIYVDKMRTSLPSKAWPYSQSCHLFADSIDELLWFAVNRLYLRSAWMQDAVLPHFDLTASKRKLAVEAGAIEVDDKWVADRIREGRRG